MLESARVPALGVPGEHDLAARSGIVERQRAQPGSVMQSKLGNETEPLARLDERAHRRPGVDAADDARNDSERLDGLLGPGLMTRSGLRDQRQLGQAAQTDRLLLGG